MRNLLLMMLAVLSLTACHDKDSVFQSNMSPIYINGKDVSANKALRAMEAENDTQKVMTVHEILTLEKIILVAEFDNDGNVFSKQFGKHVSDEQGGFRNNIDTINDRLIMDAHNIIADEQIEYLGGDFLKGRNYRIHQANQIGDGVFYGTILGYIPNDVIRKAQKDILDLWKEGKIAEIYELFNNTFYFTPCTEKEWKENYREEIDFEHEYDDILPEHSETHLIRW